MRVTIVRSPHVGGDETTAWGVTPWVDQMVLTGTDGTADVVVPHPTDGLASTYGVTLVSGAATADTRVIVPTARIALHVTSDRDRIAVGTTASFSVGANDVSSGRAVGGQHVTVELRHGSDVATQQLDLDANGVARGSFANAPLGVPRSCPRPSTGAAVGVAQVEVSRRRTSDDGRLSANVHVRPIAPSIAPATRCASARPARTRSATWYSASGPRSLPTSHVHAVRERRGDTTSWSDAPVPRVAQS